MAYKDYTRTENKGKVDLDFSPKIKQIGFEHNNPGWYNLEHSHKTCEIILLLEGKESVVVNGTNRYEVEANDLIIFNPNVIHQEFSSSTLIREAIVCTFDGFKIGDFSENQLISKNSSPIFRAKDNNKRIVELFYNMLDESRNDDNYSYSMASSYLKEIIINVLRQSEKNKKSVKKDNMECEIVINFINEHYNEKINLNDLAKMVFLSKGHLSHMFKSQIGVAPIKYLINKRIEVAKELLRNSDESINSIALRVGYSNQAYFTQFFFNETGMSPTKYRKLKKLL